MTTVTALRVHHRRIPLDRPFVTAVRSAVAVDVVQVEAVDSDGRSGWGEAATSWRVTGESPASVRATVAGPLAEAVIGREPADVTGWAATLARAVHGNSAARSAVECAVLDLAAQAAGLGFADLLRELAPGPVADVAGLRTSGPRTAIAGPRSNSPGSTGHPHGGHVRTDMTLSAPGDPAEVDALLARAVELRDMGFITLKVKVTERTDVRSLLARLRDAVGPATALRIDANQAWTAARAVREIRACEDVGVDLELVEQPVRARDLAGLAEVTAAVSIPVLADESVWTSDDLTLVAERHAADLVNVKLAKTAGPLGALVLVSAARAAGLDVLVGCMLEGTVGVTAAAHLAAATGRPGLTHDLDAGLWLTTPSADGGVRYDGDRIALPTASGLGITGIGTASAVHAAAGDVR